MAKQNKPFPSWFIPVIAVAFALLVTLIVGASRPCDHSCTNKEEKKHGEHSFIQGTNEQDYLTVAGPDGNSVRVSSKLSQMIGDLADKNSTNSATEKTVESWKAKMANNNITSSMSNFMDIVEIGNVLDGEK